MQKSLEKVKLWRPSDMDHIELMHATYVTQNFARHTHEGFAVGVIESGALGFDYRGEHLVAPAGTINLANPDEPHNGHAAAETGWAYRMFYVDADMLRHASSEIAGHPKDYPFFQAGILQDTDLARMILRIHMTLEKNEASLVEQESRVLWMLAQLIMRHADAPPLLRSAGREHRSVTRSKEYIDAHYNENISIGQLAGVACLSPFHFIRVFCKQTGLTPHKYLTQVRIRQARTLLSNGWSIASAAYETGFVDQSHLSRHFKRVVGISPGQYSNFVQDR